MLTTQQLIEKYKAEMEKMIAETNHNTVSTKPELDMQQNQVRPSLKDFPEFENNENSLSERIKQILDQNSDVSTETDRAVVEKSAVNSGSDLFRVKDNTQGDISYEDVAGQMISEKDEDVRNEMIKESCIRGGAQAQFSPPANTGFITFSENGEIIELNDTASVKIEVYAANRAYPIENAIVRIKGPADTDLFSVTVTDRNGSTEIIELAAPDRNLSLQEDYKKPYVNYYVDIQASGYQPVSDAKLQVFGGIESILPVNMVPVQENA